MRTAPLFSPALTLTGGVLLLALSACGGNAGSAAGSGTTPATPAASGMAAFATCMAENGVTLPDMGAPPSGEPGGGPSGGPDPAAASGFPGGLPAGVDQGTFDAARAACSDLAPTGGPGGPAALDDSAVAAFVSCLADHGVTVPAGADGIGALDRSDRTVAAALTTCSPLLPEPAASP